MCSSDLADYGIILVYDETNRAIGAVHAGWRGSAGGILQQTVEPMSQTFGTLPQPLKAAIGPCIGPCCFETDADVPQAMDAALGSDAAPYLAKQGSKWHVDLAGLNRQWLLNSGLKPEHIESSGLCTGCHDPLFWSHRKMGEARGAQIAMISLTHEF